MPADDQFADFDASSGLAINPPVILIPKGSSIHALYPCTAGGANAAGAFGSEQHQLSRAIGV